MGRGGCQEGFEFGDKTSKQIRKGPGTGPWLNSRVQLAFDEEQYATIKSNLQELVTLRKELVHNFLTKINVENAESCIEAEEFLENSYRSIDSHYKVLCRWANSMLHAQKVLAEAPKTSQFRDRIFADGPVRWEVSGIAQRLLDAEAELASNSCVSLNAGIAWMGQNAPEETPKRYSCRSWRQVLHESGQFEVRKQQNGAITKNSAGRRCTGLVSRSS